PCRRTGSGSVIYRQVINPTPFFARAARNPGYRPSRYCAPGYDRPGTDQAAGTAGMKLAQRPEPQAAINDVVVQIHASGFVGTELTWPSTWTDRLDRDRT